ncbi:Perakine reductase-like protein [Quillaja saponaria]|uniref:Perakine reductase-like protein n=1 Tax=Quillaja saponaria TaxID=32244 RepID=A0AAD7LB79_QUISA|nr:Perakine reductase-like protein [Quillaja saponaria]
MEKKTPIQIPRVKLGTQGLDVSRLAFGCAGLSGILNAPLSHEAGCSVIKEAFNKGITFFDTADLYGDNHDNEIMVGKALKQLPREKIQLATKFGIFRSEGRPLEVKGTPEYVRKCCETSLKRLDVEHIDLYYQHRVDISVPIEDTMGELKKLYSLWTRDIEEEIIPLCRQLGIGIVAYSSLGRGFFAGKAGVESLPNESILIKHPRFSEEHLEKNKLFYKQLEELASKHGCTPAQLALAWLLQQGSDIIPVPGTTKVKNLENNIGSVSIKLTDEDLKEISNALPIDAVGGPREFGSQYTWNFATWTILHICKRFS